jgi:hypothetical protein
LQLSRPANIVAPWTAALKTAEAVYDPMVRKVNDVIQAIMWMEVLTAYKIFEAANKAILQENMLRSACVAMKNYSPCIHLHRASV